MIDSCPLPTSSWPNGCNEGMENDGSLQIFEKDDSPLQELAIAFSGGQGEGCPVEASCQ